MFHIQPLTSVLCPLSRFTADGDLPVPTHFYTVVTSCQEQNQTVEECDGALRVFTFLLPHRADNSEACNVSTESVQQGAALSQLSVITRDRSVTKYIYFTFNLLVL